MTLKAGGWKRGRRFTLMDADLFLFYKICVRSQGRRIGPPCAGR
jgi:hypothetical protein